MLARTMLRGWRTAGLFALLVGLSACSERPTGTLTEPEVPRPPVSLSEQAALACTVSLASRSMSCSTPTPALPTNGNGLLLGGQGVYVQLTSGNLSYDAGTGAFEFDVSIQNLIGQALATQDGVNADSQGVRIFFHEQPVATGGTGTITVDDTDGSGTFTAADQPYYLYSGGLLGGDGILSPSEISGLKHWKFTVPNTVTTFAFFVFVSAEVQYPDGYVDLGMAADTLLAGGSTALSGTVRTAVGNEVIGAPIEWESSDTAVATVDGGGVITAVAPGMATITATSGIRGGTVKVAVCPDLAVGEVYTAIMPGAADLCFAGGASGNAEYTYMPVNLSNASALSLTVHGRNIVTVTGPPNPDVIDGVPMVLGHRQFSEVQERASDDRHGKMLEADRRLVSEMRARGAARISQPVTRSQLRPNMLIVPGVPNIGDLWELNVAAGCAGTLDTRVGMVRSIGNHIIIVSDTANPPGGFTTAQYDSIRMEFDSIAHPINVDNFGAPTDLDNNQRVVAFYTRAVNELSPPASSVVVLGYVASRDLFSAEPASCPRSNEGEIFYMLVPDPTGVVNSNVRTVSFVRGGTVGTLGHEFQHLINASRRIYINSAPNLEEVWLNEGLSHISEELMFYRTSVGLNPGANIQLADLTTGPNASRRVAAFNTYANQNYGRLRSFLQRPDTANAFKNNDVLAVRGAIWGFLRYAADRAGGTQSATWFNLVNSTVEGKSNLQSVFGDSPDAWLRDWIAAMYADDIVAGLAAEHQNPSWNYRSVYGGLGGVPIGTRVLTDNVGLTLSYSRGGGTAYVRFGVPTGQFAGVTALSGGVPPASPYSMIVVRTK